MRDTVKFFRSYRDAARELAKISTDEAYAYLMAILDYGLDGEEPACGGTAAAMFMLTKPNLDASIKKAEACSKGGSTPQANRKQTGSTCEVNGSAPQVNRKQTASTCEVNGNKPEVEEGRRKKEVGSKDVGSNPPKPPTGAKRTDAEFEKFWSAYPTKVGKQPARKAFDKVKVPVETLVAAIERQKCSSQWSKDGGQYIPNPATWLNQERWNDQLPEGEKPTWNQGKRELDADEQAAIRRMFGG